MSIPAMIAAFEFSASLRAESETGSQRSSEPVAAVKPLPEYPRSEIFVSYFKDLLQNLPDNHWKDELRVSSLWKLCVRKRALDQLFPEKVDSLIGWLTQMKLDTGTALHDWFQQVRLRKTGRIVGQWACRACESRLQGTGTYPCIRCPRCGSEEWKYVEIELVWARWGIKGHLDWIFIAEIDENGVPGRMIPVDLKTKRSDMFRSMRSPGLDNVYQMQIYLAMSGFDLGLLVYLDKDSGEFKEYSIVRDQRYVEDAERKLAMLERWEGAAKSGIPARECSSKEHIRAKYCEHAKACFNNRTILTRMEEKGIAPELLTL